MFSHGFRQQILDLTVEGAKVLIGPAAQLVVQGFREPQRDLLFFFVLVRFCHGLIDGSGADDGLD